MHNLYHYAEAARDALNQGYDPSQVYLALTAVGLCTLNQVDT
jgi:hypothetical protein